jgi:uncharacterized protein (DUF58 family)
MSRDARARLVGGLVCGTLAVALAIIALAAHSWYAGSLALLALVTLVLGVRTRPTQLELQVGRHEPHRVVFSYNKVWGNLAVTVDGSPVVRDLRMFSLGLTKTYRFVVGVQEAHQVRIEKDRALFLAGFRRQPVRAYVDDVLVAEGVA